MDGRMSLMIASRRGLLFGAAATLLAAPSIVRVAANLMPVSTAAFEPFGDPSLWLHRELTLSVEKFSERILKPQMIKLCDQIDFLLRIELK